MPTKSPAQHRLMEAAAHTKGGYGGVPQAVGKEFVGKDGQMDADTPKGRFEYTPVKAGHTPGVTGGKKLSGREVSAINRLLAGRAPMRKDADLDINKDPSTVALAIREAASLMKPEYLADAAERLDAACAKLDGLARRCDAVATRRAERRVRDCAAMDAGLENLGDKRAGPIGKDDSHGHHREGRENKQERRRAEGADAG